jgi:hypothetical protein
MKLILLIKLKCQYFYYSLLFHFFRRLYFNSTHQYWKPVFQALYNLYFYKYCDTNLEYYHIKNNKGESK